MKILVLPTVVALSLLVWTANATTNHELGTTEEIIGCSQANLPQQSSVQTITMHATDRTGDTTTIRAKIYWKKFADGRSGVLVRLSEPSDVRGSAFLMLQKPKRNDLFLYLPALGTVKRVTGGMMSTNFFGTDISYVEFEHIQNMSHSSSVVRLSDTVIEGRESYVIEARPVAVEPAYERIRTFVDKQTCTILRAEFYERGDEARKVFAADVSSLTEEDEKVWIARRYSVQDLRDGTHTSILIDDVVIGKPIPDRDFTETALRRGGH